MISSPLAFDDRHRVVPSPEPPSNRYLVRAHDGAVVGVVYALARGYRLWQDGESTYRHTLTGVMRALR